MQYASFNSKVKKVSQDGKSQLKENDFIIS